MLRLQKIYAGLTELSGVDTASVSNITNLLITI